MPKAKQLYIEKIDAVTELTRFGWEFEQAGGYEIKCKCPVHDDTNPSVCLSTEKNLWICQAASCGAKGDIISLLAHIGKVERGVMLAELSKRYDLEIVKSVRPETIEKYHLALGDADTLRQKLYDRGIDDILIRQARLGYHDGRIMIPIYDMNNRVINIRKYSPGAPGPEKMKNIQGYITKALYQVQQTKYDTIWVCGGEMKALVAGKYLNKDGIGAVSLTAGEGAWEPKFNHLFRGKKVYICMDIDAGGMAGARKVATQLYYEAKSVRIIYLPLDKSKHPKGDINDWVMEGAKTTDFFVAMESAVPFKLEPLDDDNVSESEVIDVKLIDSTRSEYMGRRIRTTAIATATDTTPYIIPSKVGVKCTRDQPNCNWCPIRAKEPDEITGEVSMEIIGTSPGILEMVQNHKKNQDAGICESLRIPFCKVVEFSVKEHFNVIDVRLTPQLDAADDNRDHVNQPAYLVKTRAIDLNSPYVFTGRVYPDPKNQQAVLIFDEIQESEDSLSAFSIDDKEKKELTLFRPDEWTIDGIQTKLDDIYTDFETNVTRIFYRRELHLILDLTYHSVLYFNFDDIRQNGWVNSLIAGDSAQGKSECSHRIILHYGLGLRHDCKNATPAGLLGGVQQMGTRWFVSWGIIPQNDRKLVMLEEIKGASTETLGRLTDMRSSGVAQITKIEQKKAHARTRLVMISNPRTDRPVSAYNFGVEVIKELIGGLEDVRRFDIAVILSMEQIDSEKLNILSSNRPVYKHKYESRLCKRLVLWAWTRGPDQTVFESNAVQACLKLATKLCGEFTDSLPLVDKGTMRYKLARLATALAVRTFSTDATMDSVLVRECHVEYVYDFLVKTYSAPEFGYKDFSDAQVFANKVIDPELVKKYILSTNHPKDFVEQLLHTDEVTAVDICDWCNCDRDAGQQLMSFLVRKHAIYRVKRWYVKTSEFIIILKQMKEDGIRDPEHLEKEEF